MTDCQHPRSNRLRELARAKGSTESAEVVQALLDAADDLDGMVERLNDTAFRLDTAKSLWQTWKAMAQGKLE